MYQFICLLKETGMQCANCCRNIWKTIKNITTIFTSMVTSIQTAMSSRTVSQHPTFAFDVVTTRAGRKLDNVVSLWDKTIFGIGRRSYFCKSINKIMKLSSAKFPSSYSVCAPQLATCIMSIWGYPIQLALVGWTMRKLPYIYWMNMS